MYNGPQQDPPWRALLNSPSPHCIPAPLVFKHMGPHLTRPQLLSYSTPLSRPPPRYPSPPLCWPLAFPAPSRTADLPPASSTGHSQQSQTQLRGPRCRETCFDDCSGRCEIGGIPGGGGGNQDGAVIEKVWGKGITGGAGMRCCREIDSAGSYPP
jgi:hypothetical protein